MTSGSPSSVIVERIVRVLSRFLLDGASGDAAQARLAATELLQSYGARTGADLLLAAQIIAFGFAALDNLGQSFADPDLTLAKIMRLRGNANALNRAAQQCRRALDRHGHPAPGPGSIQPAVAPVPDEPVPDEPVADAEVQAVMRKISAILGQPDLTVAEGGDAPQAAAAVVAEGVGRNREPHAGDAAQSCESPGGPSTRLQRRAAKMAARAQRHRAVQLRHAERAAAGAARHAEAARGEAAA